MITSLKVSFFWKNYIIKENKPTLLSTLMQVHFRLYCWSGFML